MKRMQLVELEDLEWFPSSIRNYGTDYLRFIGKLLYAYDEVEDKVITAMRATGRERIVDLCSGGAGPLPTFVEHLRAKGQPVQSATMTDKYPNLDAFRHVVDESDGVVDYCPDPVDATNVPEAMTGMRTLFNGFHHFPPDLARAILQDAVDKREPIAVMEMVERRMFLPAFLGGGVGSVFLAPFIKPFSLPRLLSFWLVPVTPLLIMWDGGVSCLRIYSPPELDELVESLTGTEHYRFESGVSSVLPFLPRITYLIGQPTG